MGDTNASNVQQALAKWLDIRGRYDRLQLGVSFQHVSCYGLTQSSYSSISLQATVASWAILPFQFMVQLISGRRPQQKIHILHDFSGVVRAGEMLLVLGRPGSGCSTFLKTIAGDTHGFHVADLQRINYQGIPYQQMHSKFRGERIYLAELDLHFPELTLGETLNFAADLRRNTLSCDTSDSIEDVAHIVSTLFYLDGSLDTRIGNAMIRGLSGGEKKRASIAEAFLTCAQLQCWDNSTRGLDSSTALRFVELLRRCTDALQSTVAMSVYQASEYMYQKFDKVTLLYEGRQIYFGSTDAAVDYFTRLGFVKHERTTTAEFLTYLTNPQRRVVREGFCHIAPRTPDEFAAAWRASAEAQRLGRDINAFNLEYPHWERLIAAGNDGKKEALATKGKFMTLRSSTYPMPPIQQIQTCLSRSLSRMRNNLTPIISGMIGQMVLGVVIGSVFYNLEDTTASFHRRAILLYFGLMLNAFSPAFEIYSIRAQRPVIEKQNRYALYYPFTESIASYLCDLPTKLLTSVLTNIPLYFMTNLRRAADGFFVFWLFMAVAVLTMSMFFRMLGSLSRTLEETMAPVSTVVLFYIIYTGFVIPPRYMVPWLGWIRWINPVYYAYEAVMANEFDGREFPCTNIVPAGPDYDNLETEMAVAGKVCAAIGAVPGRSTVQGEVYLSAKFGYTKAHMWRNLGILLGILAIFAVVHLVATELIPARWSRGDVLVFKRGKSSTSVKGKPTAGDEDAPTAEFPSDVLLRAPTTTTPPQSGEEDLKADGTTNIEAAREKSHNGVNVPTVTHWRDLSYGIKTKHTSVEILRAVEGWVKPGTLTALMGVTGAGKTTLLDILADRVTTGEVLGQVFVNGRHRDPSFGRRIGYAQQEDIHLPTSTVREALEFSALLRYSGGDDSGASSLRDAALNYIDQILDLLGMISYAEAVIGVPGEGLNVEQRKRLTIAVEMVARPELLLFLDEPTSGLDSQTAWSIVRLLRKLADNGQAILCTIHRPSSQLFEMFDRVLLLGEGGKVLYFGNIGQDSSTLVNYFERNGPGACPAGANPAEWMVELTRVGPTEIGEEAKGTEIDWARAWKDSDERKAVLRHLHELETTPATATALVPLLEEDAVGSGSPGRFAATFYQQLVMVCERTFKGYWRDPLYVYSRLGLCSCVSLANGLSFYNTTLDIQGLTNLLFSIFLVTQLFTTISQQVIPQFTDQRTLFEARERRDRSYSWIVFLTSNIATEAVLQTLSSLLILACWYYPTGMWRSGESGGLSIAERGGLVFCLVWMFSLWTTTLSHALAAGIEHAETSVNLAVLLYWLSLVFCGVLVAPGALPGFWIFMYRASPFTYLMKGLVVAGLADTRLACSTVEMLHIDLPKNGSASTCGAYLGVYVQTAGGYILNQEAMDDCQYCPVSETNVVLELFGIEVEDWNPWESVGFLVVYIVFNILATFGFYWLGRVPRWKVQS